MAHVSPSRTALTKVIFRQTAFFSLILAAFASGGFAQTCSVSSSAASIHVEGLAERVGDITVACTGGSGGTINTLVAIALNANVTNRLDVNGNLTGVTITGSGVANQIPPALNSANVVLFSSVNVPGTSPVFTISGLRVAVPTVTTGGTNPFINASVNANQLALPTQPIVVAISAPTLLASYFNYGLPCTGSPAPASIDVPTLIATGTASSTLRVTEASLAGFTPKTPGADFGVRILVTISGYGSNSTVYVQDVIVGNRAQSPTTTGALGGIANGGTYVPGQNTLLLARVVGADATGVGGTPVLTVPPGGTTSIGSAFQVPLVNGSGTVTYEVIDASNAFIDSAQIPVYVAVAASSCAMTPSTNTLAASLAPVSTVSIPTLTDPIPRYISSVPGSDCATLGDCSAAYFPILQVSPSALTLNGQSQAFPQTAYITVTNGGSNQLSFNVTTAYQPTTGQSSANWLTLSSNSGVVGPTSGVTSFTLGVTADPSALLVPGVYLASVTINAGSAGTVTIPVTFNVAVAGPIIQSVVNSANSQPGAVTAGSFVTLYGVNLVPKNPPATVTFNGFPGTISYDGQPSASGPAQINVLVPAALGLAGNAGVVATIDGVPSNTFAIKLVTNAPAVFNPGILNQNNSVNLASAPASRGDIIQIFLTGLATPVTLPVTVNIGTQTLSGNQIIYAGAVPSIPGLEQVNVQVPPALQFTGKSVGVSICVPGSGGQAACSVPVSLYLQ
jgi:uncharacterized protein (TIGR03437 family)